MFNEFKDALVWSYEGMSDLNDDIIILRLPLRPECKLVRHKFRHMNLKWNMKIKEEAVKQLEADCLEISNYPEWLANIVPVPKKDGC